MVFEEVERVGKNIVLSSIVGDSLGSAVMGHPASNRLSIISKWLRSARTIPDSILHPTKGFELNPTSANLIAILELFADTKPNVFLHSREDQDFLDFHKDIQDELQPMAYAIGSAISTGMYLGIVKSQYEHRTIDPTWLIENTYWNVAEVNNWRYGTNSDGYAAVAYLLGKLVVEGYFSIKHIEDLMKYNLCSGPLHDAFNDIQSWYRNFRVKKYRRMLLDDKPEKLFPMSEFTYFEWNVLIAVYYLVRVSLAVPNKSKPKQLVTEIVQQEQINYSDALTVFTSLCLASEQRYPLWAKSLITKNPAKATVKEIIEQLKLK